VLLDRTGRLLRILNEASGLRDEIVRYSYVDRQGGLWLALSNGLARVETGAPLSYWNKTSGLDGNVKEVARHQGRLYAATTQGVYSLASASEGAAPRFLPCPGISTQCWALLSTPQGLLAGCQGGLYNVDDQQLILPHNGHVLEVVRSRRDTTLLYLGLDEGLARLHFTAGQWTEVGRRDHFDSVHSIVEDAQGRLWTGTDGEGVFRLQAVLSDDPVITRFGVADGLPFGTNRPRTVAGRVMVWADQGARLFRLAAGADSVRFVPDTTFDAFLPRRSGSIEYLTEDDRGRVWIAAGADSGVAQPAAEGGYTWAPTALRRAPTRDIDEMHVETGGPLWVGGPHGLIRYDTNHSLDPSTSYPVRIRRITTSAGSVFYHGRPGDLPAEWPYRDNALRFAFAAPRYDAPGRTQYRVRLDGHDDDWSAWVNETDKDYTDLWEGRYVFRVEARDVYGLVSREDTFAFRILPPWYRGWWAYSLYGLAFAALVAAYVRSNRKKLQRERAVSARLREVDKLKDEFLANTSHELRT
ncbi:MAG: hypothetical protein GY925_07445, partial [Actinomycetia bacterium]|nr:hypothetical protein [Actinomycetes bacterium]